MPSPRPDVDFPVADLTGRELQLARELVRRDVNLVHLQGKITRELRANGTESGRMIGNLRLNTGLQHSHPIRLYDANARAWDGQLHQDERIMVTGELVYRTTRNGGREGIVVATTIARVHTPATINFVSLRGWTATDLVCIRRDDALYGVMKVLTKRYFRFDDTIRLSDQFHRVILRAAVAEEFAGRIKAGTNVIVTGTLGQRITDGDEEPVVSATSVAILKEQHEQARAAGSEQWQQPK